MSPKPRLLCILTYLLILLNRALIFGKFKSFLTQNLAFSAQKACFRIKNHQQKIFDLIRHKIRLILTALIFFDELKNSVVFPVVWDF